MGSWSDITSRTVEEKLDIETDVSMNQKYNGTLLSIKVPHSEKNRYIRFRITDPIASNRSYFISKKKAKNIRSVFSENYTPQGSFYQSVRNSVDAIDLRINDNKSLDSTLLNEHANHFLIFSKIHFFLIHDQQEDILQSSITHYKTRLLEHSSWKKYLNNISGHTRNYCATRWTCRGVSSWEIFIKIKFCNSNALTIICYLLFAFVFAMTVNICSAFLYDFVNQHTTKPICTITPFEENKTI